MLAALCHYEHDGGVPAYGRGLRVAELVHLKPQDIHSERMLIRVNQGKGHKDRYTLLFLRLLEEHRPALGIVRSLADDL
ncbi:MAG: hypothetical protein ACLP9L_13000 [Thermoguttaceae bacterium]